MKNKWISSAVMLFVVTGSYAQVSSSIQTTLANPEIMYLKTDDGTKVKIYIPREEVIKLQNVKSGDSVELLAPVGNE